LLTGFYFEKVHRERVYDVAYCCGAHRKQSENKRMADEVGKTNMEKVTELLHGHFHFKVLPDGAVDRAKVIYKHC